jgi:hypothetical protein
VVRKTIQTPPASARKVSPSDQSASRPAKKEDAAKPDQAADPSKTDGDTTQPAGTASKPSSQGPGEAEAPSAPKAGLKDGWYTVQPGDSLAVIAGREDVLGDPLKWPVLYQLNRETLSGVTLDARLPERLLKEGVRLRYTLTPEERERAEDGPNRYWVVNVISSPTADRIDGPAVRLLEKRYPVYISRATVKGQKWMRLRVGFFQDRGSAVDAGKTLQKVLDQEDSWPVRIGPEETAEYADLLTPLHEG